MPAERLKDAQKRKPVSGRSQGGRPIEFTPEKVAAICDRVRQGTFVKHACHLERKSRSGLYEAAERDPSIAEELKTAQAEGAEMYRAKLMMALGSDWKREAWMLERWDRDTFKPPKAEVESKAEVTGKDGAPLPGAVIVVTEEQLLAGAAKKLGGG